MAEHVRGQKDKKSLHDGLSKGTILNMNDTVDSETTPLMSTQRVPATWLIILLCSLPQISENIYTPSLPDIARSLKTSPTLVEYTLTIYLFAFAIGTLFWGCLSDRVGRKPCVLMGLLFFVLGCLGCYTTHSIGGLLFFRFVQAFGGSIGSVIVQSITRDVFHGPALTQMYSVIIGALAISPALGPITGGLIVEYFSWPYIFLFLMVFGILVGVVSAGFLPETHHPEDREVHSIQKILGIMLCDPKVLFFALVVGGCNGLLFSYFAEAPFYLIENLGLSPSQYGLTFMLLASATFTGAKLVKHLQNSMGSLVILKFGLRLLGGVAFIWSGIVCYDAFMGLSHPILIGITVMAQMLIMLAVPMSVSPSLSLALVQYKWCTGTASSLFGFVYYLLIMLCTLGMGSLHNGTLLPMPFYFMGITLLMLGMHRVLKIDATQ